MDYTALLKTVVHMLKRSWGSLHTYPDHRDTSNMCLLCRAMALWFSLVRKLIEEYTKREMENGGHDEGTDLGSPTVMRRRSFLKLKSLTPTTHKRKKAVSMTEGTISAVFKLSHGKKISGESVDFLDFEASKPQGRKGSVDVPQEPPPSEEKLKVQPDRPRKLAMVQSHSEFEVVSCRGGAGALTPPSIPPAYKKETQEDVIPPIYKIFQLCIKVSVHLSRSSPPSLRLPTSLTSLPTSFAPSTHYFLHLPHSLTPSLPSLFTPSPLNCLLTPTSHLTPSPPHSLPTALPSHLTPSPPHSLPTSLPPHLTPSPLTSSPPHSLSTALPPYLTPSPPHSLPTSLPLPCTTPYLTPSPPHCMPPHCNPFSPPPPHFLSTALPPHFTPSPPHSLPTSLPPHLTPSPPHSLPTSLPTSLPHTVQLLTLHSPLYSSLQKLTPKLHPDTLQQIVQCLSCLVHNGKVLEFTHLKSTIVSDVNDLFHT